MWWRILSKERAQHEPPRFASTRESGRCRSQKTSGRKAGGLYAAERCSAAEKGGPRFRANPTTGAVGSDARTVSASPVSVSTGAGPLSGAGAVSHPPEWKIVAAHLCCGCAGSPCTRACRDAEHASTSPHMIAPSNANAVTRCIMFERVRHALATIPSPRISRAPAECQGEPSAQRIRIGASSTCSCCLATSRDLPQDCVIFPEATERVAAFTQVLERNESK